MISNQIWLWCGLILVGLMLIQGLMMVINSFRQAKYSTQQHQHKLLALREDVARKSLKKDQAKISLQSSWSGLRKFRIAQKIPEGGGICSFYLVAHDGKSLPPFQPGQYLTFNLKVPQQKKDVVRCYSLSDSPQRAEEYYRVSIKHALPPPKAPDAPPGVSSSFFHEQLHEGDIVDVRAPGGNFYLDNSYPSPIVLIGGGVGLTPVLSMMNSIVDGGSNREVWFFYGVRNSTEHIMSAHFKKLKAEHDNINIIVCYSDPLQQDNLGDDYDYQEWVSVDLMKRALPSNNYDFYICGPPPMMATLVNDLGEWGVPDKHIHFEAFGPASVKKTSSTQDKDSTASNAQQAVTFAKSDKTCQWETDSGTLLDLAEENDIALDFGCRAGSCGTCKTAILSGEVNYLDPPSAPLEAGSCLPCIAIPKNAVTIDA